MKSSAVESLERIMEALEQIGAPAHETESILGDRLITLSWPAMPPRETGAWTNTILWSEKYGQWKEEISKHPHHSAYSRMIHPMANQCRSYSLFELSGDIRDARIEFVEMVLTITSQYGTSASRESDIETMTYRVGKRWVVWNDGKIVVPANGRITGFDTEAEARKALAQWTKRILDKIEENRFVNANGAILQHLSHVDAKAYPSPTRYTKVGDKVGIIGKQRLRVGVVMATTKTRVKVAWTTPTGRLYSFTWHKKHGSLV